MSSESDNNHDHDTSPRKRRRLGSLDHAHNRKQHVLRRRQVEAKYNDRYRILFNDHVTGAASHPDVNESVQHYSTQIGSSLWSSTEQARFFVALERLGKDDLPGIARAIETKTTIETRAFLDLLHDAASKQGDTKLTLRDIPAAVDVGHACSQQLDDAAEALAWYQEKLEASQEQERYGDLWLITPSIAEDIEHAVNGVTRPPTSASSILEREPKRHGNGVNGACTHCKKRKVKCDRKSPCTQCAKSKTHCVYPTIPPVPSKPVNGPEEFSDHRSDVEALASENGEFRILQAIPEADLLCPDTMLTLSRELFMNRSAEFSSPWPHWSHYISELATEPSIYRTALNDLHRLVVSLTRRLVQTTIIQATSRLRAQRLRKEKKGLLPFVKLKDVYAAIDILGMKRNGSERWRGVPRRCGLKVVTSRKTPRGKSTREVPWSEIEGIMGSVAMPDEQAASEAEASAESNNFQSRAIRSGTPLPMHGLTLSDSEGELRSVGTTDDSGDSDDSDFSEHFVADKLQSSVRHDFQPRDHIGRYTSALSKRTNDEAPKYLNTLEEFDQEASRLEESMLWDTLSMQPAANSDLKIDERVKDDDSDIHDKVTTTSNNWRQTLDYRASWEKYKTSVSVAKLITNQQPSNHALFNFGTRTWTIAPSVAGISDASITRNTEGRRERSRTEIELQARGTNAYAALQREVLESSSQGFGSSSSGNDRALPEQDIPAESVEA